MAEQKNAVAVIRETITGSQMQAEIAKALPKHIGTEKFTRVALTAINSNPSIVNANRNSILAACMSSAQDGLLPDGREAALVVFSTKNGKVVQYMPMVAGILKKVRNSGDLRSLDAQVVHENDEFEYEAGDEGRIFHKPTIKGDPGEMIGVYAVATLKTGEKVREFMRMDEIEKVRKSSRASSNGPWVDWFTEMARKTVIRRLAKRLPSSSDLTSMLEANDEFVGMKDITPKGDAAATEPPTEPKKRKTSSDRLKAATAPADAPEEPEEEQQEEVPPPKNAPKEVTDVDEPEQQEEENPDGEFV